MEQNYHYTVGKTYITGCDRVAVADKYKNGIMGQDSHTMEQNCFFMGWAKLRCRM